MILQAVVWFALKLYTSFIDKHTKDFRKKMFKTCTWKGRVLKGYIYNKQISYKVRQNKSGKIDTYPVYTNRPRLQESPH